jgi:hypothetical protein
MVLISNKTTCFGLFRDIVRFLQISVVRGYMSLYNVRNCVPIYTDICRYIPIYKSIYTDIPIYSDIYRYIPIYADICWYMPIYTYIYQYIPIYTVICRYIPIYADIYRYTPLYADIYRYIPIYKLLQQQSFKTWRRPLNGPKHAVLLLINTIIYLTYSQLCFLTALH